MSRNSKAPTNTQVARHDGGVSIIGSPELVVHVNAIRQLGKQTIANVISIGEHLTECKRIVGHGGFADFLMREFRWTGRHARSLMQVSEASKTENFSDLNLPVSGLSACRPEYTGAAARGDHHPRREGREDQG